MSDNLILGAMCGAIAEAFYGNFDKEMTKNVMDKLDDFMKDVVVRFSKMISEKELN